MRVKGITLKISKCKRLHKFYYLNQNKGNILQEKEILKLGYNFRTKTQLFSYFVMINQKHSDQTNSLIISAFRSTYIAYFI